MSLIRKKLRSQDGATLILALLFFVVCAAIGSVVLTAASVSAGRLKNIQSGDQHRYAVRSARSVLEKELTEGSFKAVYQVDGNALKEKSAPGSSSPAGAPAGSLADLRNDLMRSVMNSPSAKNYLTSLLPTAGQGTGKGPGTMPGAGSSILPGNRFSPAAFAPAEQGQYRSILTFPEENSQENFPDAEGPVQAEVTMQSDGSMKIRLVRPDSDEKVDWERADADVDAEFTLTSYVQVSYASVLKDPARPGDGRVDQLTVKARWTDGKGDQT